MEEFDYIIVGAGTAGCVLAERLSADRRTRVLILEAGGSDQRFWIKTPIGYGRTFADRRVNWMYQAEPSAGLNGRSMYWPRGKVLGGSSSINALVYCRGLPEDFDGWAALGNASWGWNAVKAYFERSERFVDSNGQARGEGALDVKDVTALLHPMHANWLAAAAELQLPVTDDFNGEHPLGLGCYQITVRDGRRWSAADAFLRPALARPNVRLVTDALVSKLRIESRRAVGLEYALGNTKHTATAQREVILCAGTVNSPQLLQLSGIGDGAELSAMGITPVLDNKAVGENLQDHLAVVYSYRATRPTLNNELHSNFAKLKVGLRYLLTRRGPAALSVNQFGGFVRTNPESPGLADVQLYCNPVTYPAGDFTRKRINVDAFAGFYLCYQPTRPTSVGRIKLAGPDYRQPPRIFPNYLSTHKDVTDVKYAARFLKSLAQTRAIGELIKEPVGPDILRMNDSDMIEDFKARAATVYHPVGSCRMGPAADGAVVDAKLRVHGIEALRIADASVFPTLTAANTNAPTLMVAQKAADLIHETR
ncbi:MAG TPA: GMC family oxidoreductase N-terminal domain-containing protein [Steroidobacteraceae bacterium]